MFMQNHNHVRNILMIVIVFTLFSSLISAAYTDDIIEHWDFEGDSSGYYGNYDASQNSTFEQVTGYLDNAYIWNADEYMEVQGAVSTGTEAGLTVCFWANATDNSTRRTVIGKYSTDNHREFYLDLGDTGNILNAQSTNKVDYMASISNANYRLPNTWYYYCMSWQNGTDSNNLRLYIDGSEVAYSQQQTMTGKVVDLTRTMHIGNSAYSAGRNFLGVLDEITIWSRGLTDTEISDLYDHNVAGYHIYETAGDTNKTYYYSNSGDDANDCLTVVNACKTITDLNTQSLNSGDKVLFDRGNIWRFVDDDYIDVVDGVYYSTYGTGQKPIFSGGTIIVSFTDTGNNIWRSDNTSSTDVGNILFDGIHGVKKDTHGALANNLDFWYNTTDDKVYIYYGSDPSNTFTKIEIASKGDIFDIDGAKNNTFVNLSIRNGGSHGIAGDDNLFNITIMDCNFTDIGGSFLTGTTRYGNCVQFGLASDTILVTRNRFYQCYDAAMTSQEWNASKDDIVNQEWSYNIVEKSAYGYEQFAQHSDTLTENISIHHNTFIDSGRGFGEEQGRSIVIAQQIGVTRNITIKDNIFENSNWREVDIGRGLPFFYKGELPYINYDFYDSTNTTQNFIYWNGSTYSTLAAFQVTGNETNGLSGSSLLDGDYVPAYNSPVCGDASDGEDIGALPCADVPYSGDTLLLYTPFFHSDSDLVSTPDYSSYGNNCTVVGVTQNNYYNSYDFDGDEHYLDCGNDGSLNNNGSFSVFAWVSKSFDDSERTIMGKAPSNGAHGWEFRVKQFGQMSFRARQEGQSTVTYLNGVNIKDRQNYNHLGVVWNKDDLRILWYINGNLVDNDTIFNTTLDINSFTDPLRIGVAGYKPVSWNGSITEVRYYNKSLSQLEVEEIHNLSYTHLFEQNVTINFNGINMTMITRPGIQEEGQVGEYLTDPIIQGFHKDVTNAGMERIWNRRGSNGSSIDLAPLMDDCITYNYTRLELAVNVTLSNGVIPFISFGNFPYCLINDSIASHSSNISTVNPVFTTNYTSWGDYTAEVVENFYNKCQQSDWDCGNFSQWGWEIGNEWYDLAEAGEYYKYFNASYLAIKDVVPSAKVGTGALGRRVSWYTGMMDNLTSDSYPDFISVHFYDYFYKADPANPNYLYYTFDEQISRTSEMYYDNITQMYDAVNTYGKDIEIFNSEYGMGSQSNPYIKWIITQQAVPWFGSAMYWQYLAGVSGEMWYHGTDKPTSSVGMWNQTYTTYPSYEFKKEWTEYFVYGETIYFGDTNRDWVEVLMGNGYVAIINKYNVTMTTHLEFNTSVFGVDGYVNDTVTVDPYDVYFYDMADDICVDSDGDTFNNSLEFSTCGDTKDIDDTNPLIWTVNSSTYFRVNLNFFDGYVDEYEPYAQVIRVIPTKTMSNAKIYIDLNSLQYRYNITTGSLYGANNKSMRIYKANTRGECVDYDYVNTPDYCTLIPWGFVD